MRKLFYIACWVMAVALILLLAYFLPVNTNAQSVSVWFPVTNYNSLRPVNANWGLYVPGLATSTTGCLSIDSRGYFSASGSACGAGAGGGGFDFPLVRSYGNATTTQLVFDGGFSSRASSTVSALLTFELGSSTSFSVADRLWVAGAGTSTIISSLTLPRLNINSQTYNDLASLGLTNIGGGLSIGSGTCITVNADSIAVTSNCTDAATIDSIDGASFLRSDTSDSFTSGAITFDAGTDLLVTDGFGYGTATPVSVFSVRGDLVQSSGGATFLGPVKGPTFTSTSTTLANTFPIASTTSFSVADRLWVAGAGTSTFIGPLTAAGLRSTAGLEVTAGGIHLASAITGTSVATSSLAGGLTLGTSGLTIANGLYVTAGAVRIPLLNCNTLDTNGNGQLSCGTDETGAGVSGSGGTNQISYWTSATNLAATSTPTAANFFATSTSVASTFPIASTTSFSVVDRLWVAGAGTSTFSGSILPTRIGLGGNTYNNLVGAGLAFAGGGIDVGAGTCITVAADTVAVTSNCTDAATVDAIEGASFLRSDASDTFSLATGILDLAKGAKFGVGTDTPGAALGVFGEGLFAGRVSANNFVSTSTTNRSIFPIASTTSFSIDDRLWVAGTGTSTFSGPVTAAGLRSTAGLQVTTGGIHLASAITNTNIGTSSFSGGIATAGLSSSNGMNITAGCYSINGVCIATGGSGTPGGSDTQIQYNNGNVFGGTLKFVYDDTKDFVGIGTTSPGAMLAVGGRALFGDLFASTTLSIPFGVAATASSTGALALDTSADHLIYRGTSTTHVLSDVKTKTITLTGPTDADNILMGKLWETINIQRVFCITDPADSADSVIIDVQELNDVGDSASSFDTTITCDNDGATDDGSISNAQFDAGDMWALDIGAVTGTSTQVSVTIKYVLERE